MFEFLLDRLINLLGPIATLSREKREIKDDALRAISIALRETQIYYRDLGHRNKRNRDKEAQLVKYWAAAAIPLRHIDEELAMICEHKADFWLEPENWSNEDIERVGIKLTDVSSAYRKLAMPSGFSTANKKYLTN